MKLLHLPVLGFVMLGTGLGADISFNRDVRPILSDNCFFCHGTDAKERKAGLRLDTFEGATAEQDGVRAIVPGDPAKSAAWERILSDDPDAVMPPPKSHKKLSAAQKDILKRWIAAGAKYEPHWSFSPIQPVAVPIVKQAQWPRGDLDRFLLARLEAEGLSPAPEASKEALIRRVTLDLTGLPPTPAEVEAFLRDTSGTAYETVVDRLLKSAHFGERMAVDWLDAARYADTNGYQVDRDRELWPWRDWVIRAFNENKPFDQFTIEQLAGDLLPGATLDQKVATGFHRNHMLNEEGGVIADEFLAEYTADRVETTAAVWLGQTFNCARCHDHKYDPFTQRDFYAMKAFFHNVPERGVGLYSNPVRTNAPPFVRLPAPEVEARIAKLNEQSGAVSAQMAALASGTAAGVDEWAAKLASTSVAWREIELIEAKGGDQPPVLEPSRKAVAIGPQETRSNTITIRAKLPAGRISALRLVCEAVDASASVRWSEFKVGNKPALGLRPVVAGNSLAAAELTKVLDGDRRTVAAIGAAKDRPVEAVFELETAREAAEGEMETAFEIGIENAGGGSRWRLFLTDADPSLLAPTAIVSLAKKEPSKRSPAESKQLADFRLAQQPEHRRLSDELASLKKQIEAAELEIPTTLVMEELKEPRPTHILMRGAYDKPGEAVTAATPVVLPPLREGDPSNRLGLARWLVDERNPLTARVTVNRVWQAIFGTGLVRTSEDFGSQGEVPSHPELLDWLAWQFRERGWDMKGLVRLMVTSAAYRQQSAAPPALRERDPVNRLLARGPRFRLSAEMIRDQALAASGLLVAKIGGPSVKPYHPPGLYEQVVAQRDNPKATYQSGQGDDLHRRSLYTYWKRSVPHPAMLVFDAPFRETCSLARQRTNTPLQALNLMNDPTYVEAARFLAQRMEREGGATAEARLEHGFRLLLARMPNGEELALLKRALDRAQADFGKDPEAAKALLTVGEAKHETSLDPVELASYATVAMTLLNLDETVMK
ncbi:MAG: PSD1 domain-containing protein [Verrucomicrobiales bacterium]|nr:PSD1 domain-containing protein [Verrucomicrobiales bacterium]